MAGTVLRHRRLRPGGFGDRAHGWPISVAPWSWPTWTPRPTGKQRRRYPARASVRWTDLTDGIRSSAWSPTSLRRRSSTSPRSSRRPSTGIRDSHGGSTSTPPQRWCASPRHQPTPPRFIQASSNAVFGARNPHTATAPVRRRRSDAAVRPVQRNQGRGGGDRAVLEAGVGGAAARWGAEHRSSRRCRSAPTPCTSRACCRPTTGCTASTSATSRGPSPPRPRPTSRARSC